MERRFELVEGGSRKFWLIRTDGRVLTTTYGRIGTAGKVATKELETATACAAEAEKLVREKLRKGYREVVLAPFAERDFWSLVDRARHGSEGDPDLLAERLTAALAERPVEDILAFERILQKQRARAYTSALWAAAYAINGGCSDDGFEYFGGWLISRGRETFEQAVADPDSLVRVVRDGEEGGCENESLLYAAAMAWEQRAGAAEVTSAPAAAREVTFHDAVEASGGTAHLPRIELDWEETRESVASVVPKLVRRFWPEDVS